MEQEIKEIVAKYTLIPTEEITASTVIDRTSVANSIVLHRLYAKLAENGFKVDNYQTFKTFGDILKQNNVEKAETYDYGPLPVESLDTASRIAIGIDIEEISELPIAEDVREHEFYKMNFAPSEISYCILQPNQYASFAGLFVAKEAIVKANNNYKNIPFNKIIIDHLANGQPVHDNYHLSISHTNNIVVCVAALIKEKNREPIDYQEGPQAASNSQYRFVLYLCFFTLLLSLSELIYILHLVFQ